MDFFKSIYRLFPFPREKYDSKATGYISMHEIGDFLDELEPPLRLAKPNKIKVKHLVQSKLTSTKNF